MNFRLHPAVLVGLVLAICAGLVAGIVYFRGRKTATAGDLAAYLPAEDGVLLAIDLTTLKQAGVLEALGGSGVAQEPEYAAFVRETGFNYQEDLKYILAWFGSDSTVMLLRGRFEWGKLKAYAERQKGRCRNAYCSMVGSTPERHISFFPLSRDVLALGVGPSEWTATLLVGQKPSRRGMAIRNRPVWVMAPAGALKNSDRLPAGTRLFVKAMEGAEQVELSLATAETGAAIELDVMCRTPGDASTLAFQLEGVTRVLKSMISREQKNPNPGDLSGVLAAGVFNRVDRRVLGHWPVERQFLESILKDSQ